MGSKNMVAWSGVQHHEGLTAKHADLHTDLADLEAKENQLDDLIKNAELHLKLLNEDKGSDAAALPSPIKIKQEVNDHLDSTPTNRAFSTPNQMAASNHQTWEEGDDQAIKNVLIFESEDLGPIGNRFQQQTVDQEHHDNTLTNNMGVTTPQAQLP